MLVLTCFEKALKNDTVTARSEGDLIRGCVSISD